MSLGCTLTPHADANVSLTVSDSVLQSACEALLAAEVLLSISLANTGLGSGNTAVVLVQQPGEQLVRQLLMQEQLE